MKPIDQLQTFIEDVKSVFAPVLQTQLETLVTQVKADKPTVVIHLDGGVITWVSHSTPVQIIIADYDVKDSNETIKETPEGCKATIEFSDSGEFIDESCVTEWVALANQE